MTDAWQTAMRGAGLRGRRRMSVWRWSRHRCGVVIVTPDDTRFGPLYPGDNITVINGTTQTTLRIESTEGDDE